MEELLIASQLGNSPAPGVGTRREAAACFPPSPARCAPVLRDKACHREAAGNGGGGNWMESAQAEDRQDRFGKGGVTAHEGCARGGDEHGRTRQARGFEQQYAEQSHHSRQPSTAVLASTCVTMVERARSCEGKEEQVAGSQYWPAWRDRCGPPPQWAKQQQIGSGAPPAEADDTVEFVCFPSVCQS